MDVGNADGPEQLTGAVGDGWHHAVLPQSAQCLAGLVHREAFTGASPWFFSLREKYT